MTTKLRPEIIPTESSSNNKDIKYRCSIIWQFAVISEHSQLRRLSRLQADELLTMGPTGSCDQRLSKCTMEKVRGFART